MNEAQLTQITADVAAAGVSAGTVAVAVIGVSATIYGIHKIVSILRG